MAIKSCYLIATLHARAYNIERTLVGIRFSFNFRYSTVDKFNLAKATLILPTSACSVAYNIIFRPDSTFDKLVTRAHRRHHLNMKSVFVTDMLKRSFAFRIRCRVRFGEKKSIYNIYYIESSSSSYTFGSYFERMILRFRRVDCVEKTTRNRPPRSTTTCITRRTTV